MLLNHGGCTRWWINSGRHEACIQLTISQQGAVLFWASALSTGEHWWQMVLALYMVAVMAVRRSGVMFVTKQWTWVWSMWSQIIRGAAGCRRVQQMRWGVMGHGWVVVGKGVSGGWATSKTVLYWLTRGPKKVQEGMARHGKKQLDGRRVFSSSLPQVWWVQNVASAVGMHRVEGGVAVLQRAAHWGQNACKSQPSLYALEVRMDEEECYNTVRTPTLWIPDTSDRPVYFPFNLLNLATPL